MDKIYDAIVVGAGPAGTSSAYFLREAGLDILILEKSVFPRHKVCGEFISPAAWKIIDAMKVRQKIQETGYHPIERAVMYAPSGKNLEIEFKPIHGLGLSRAKLDDILLNHVKSVGVEVCEGILVTDRQWDRDVWNVKGHRKDSKIPEIFKGRRLIVASGKTGYLSKQTRKKGMFGIKAHFRGVKDLNNVTEIFSLNGIGYGGIVQIENGLANACFLLNTEKVPLSWISQKPDEFLKWTLELHPIFKNRIKGAERVGHLLTTGPLPFGLRAPSESSSEIRAGDALGVIDPFFGEGITLALEAGFLLGESLKDKEFGKLIQKNFWKRFLLGQTMRFFSKRPRMLNGLIWSLSKNKTLTQYLFRSAHGIS